MRDLTGRALDTATALGATYADVRVVQRRTQSISVKNGRVEEVADDQSQGFGIRVVVDGAWGFVGSANVDMRSFRLNFELIAVLYDQAIVRELSPRKEPS